jgi:hypothetical protein
MGLFSQLSAKLLPQSIEDVISPVIKPIDKALFGAPSVARTEQGQATAVSVPGASRQQATETAFSGEVSAMSPVQPVQSFTGLLPQIIQRAPQIARGARDIAIGVGAGTLLQGDRGGMGIFNVKINDRGTLTGLSRKEQRQAKQLVELVGFDEAAAMIGVPQQVMAMILLKKFSRGGQGITAAQLRNAQRVNNRIVHMHKTLEQSFKKSTTAARRRTTGTRVTQIKN